MSDVALAESDGDYFQNIATLPNLFRPQDMYVYLIKSLKCPDKQYRGFARNLKKRLAQHNHDKIGYTSKFTPWKLRWAMWFSEEKKARKFEIYLKSGSGRAFA